MEIKGDFLSFKFDGHDISEFGAVRTSDGDRYDESLQPEIKDISSDVPGMHGEYYFGSTFGKKNISVSFAFDFMTELQFKEMRRVFACNKTSELIFSERPYKKYLAKIESPIELSYICFDVQKKEIDYSGDARGVRRDKTSRQQEVIYPYILQEGTQRIYKGEGKINFICYFPFAKSCYKTLPFGGQEQERAYWNNVNEWSEASGILDETTYNTAQLDRWVNHPSDVNKGRFLVYNPGDVDTGFRLYCPFGSYTNELSIVYYINTATMGAADNWQEQTRLVFNPITKLVNTETGFLIDTNNELVTGVSSFSGTSLNGNATYTTDGQLYNKFIKAGEFFKIKPTQLGNTNEALIEIINGNASSQIFYDYLYF